MITPSYNPRLYKNPDKGIVQGNWYAVGKLLKSKGFEVEYFDWTSSAGDWTLLVTKDFRNFQIVSQENTWKGFEYSFGTQRIRANSMEEAVKILADVCEREFNAQKNR